VDTKVDSSSDFENIEFSDPNVRRMFNIWKLLWTQEDIIMY